MKNIIWLFLLSVLSTKAQDMKVSEKILKEITTINFAGKTAADTIELKVVFPKDYKATKKYPVLLGLSGGNQSAEIGDYCFAAWFRNVAFRNHIIVMPVNTKYKSMKDYSSDDILNLYKIIDTKFRTKSNYWILSATSNGGVAAFKFIVENPNIFDKAFLIPGKLTDGIKLDKNWKHLSIVMAYG